IRCVEGPFGWYSLSRHFFDSLNSQKRYLRLPASEVSFYSRQELAPGPTATTKYVAGVAPTFLIPCSSLECTNPTEPGPRRELVPSTVSSTVPSRISHISECTWWCAGWGAPPGGSVVSCTSNDSPVASLPFRTSRICALFGVRIGSFSNGYIADGMDSSCAAMPSGRITAGTRAAGSKRHISRRVMDMYFSFCKSQTHRSVNSNKCCRKAPRHRDQESLACRHLSTGAFCAKLFCLRCRNGIARRRCGRVAAKEQKAA